MKPDPLRSFADLDPAKFARKPADSKAAVEAEADVVQGTPASTGSGEGAFPTEEASKGKFEDVVSKRQRLEARERELDSTKHDLERARAQLERERTKLDQEKRDLESANSRKQDELASHARQLAKFEQQLKQKEKENYRRQHELDELAAVIEPRVRSLDEAERALEPRIRAVEEREKTSEALTEQIGHLEKEAESLSLRLRESSSRIAALETERGDLKNSLDSSERKLANTKDVLARTRETHKAELRDLTAQLEESRSQIAELAPYRSRHQRAASNLEAAKQEIKGLRESLSKVRTAAETFEKLADLNIDTDTEFYLTDPVIINWLASELIDDPFVAPDHVTVLGEEPVDHNQWLGHLEEWDCQAWENGNEWIIIGRSGWNPEEIDALVEEREGESIRIVSQELFLAAMISGHDPFDADEEVLLAFAKGHPALEYLLESFEWPFFEDDLPPDGPQNFDIDAVEKSPLKLMGYTVGRNGLPQRRRRRILEDAYRGEIPWVDPQSYMSEWGRPRSRRRLW